MNVAVVMPTHNRWIEARKSIECLLADSYESKIIILVDDGSVDGTYEYCCEQFPNVHLHKGHGDLWWSGAINQGVEHAQQNNADFILWLNDDNRVENHTITKLIESHRRLGPRSIVCAITKSIATGEYEWAGDPPRWHPEFGKWGQPDLNNLDVPLEHPPGGRGVLFPIDCFKEIGGIDQKSFPHYWADHDFHYRAMNAGYKYYLATEAVVWNVPNKKREGTPDDFTIRWIWNFLFTRRSSMNLLTLRRLLKRHLEPSEYRATFFPMVLNTLTWLASGWVVRKPLLHKSLRVIRRAVSI